MTGLAHKVAGAYRQAGLGAACTCLAYNALKKTRAFGLSDKLYARQLKWQLDAIRTICCETLDRYKAAVCNVESNHIDDGRKIYSIWLQGENSAPPVVKSCLTKLRKLYGDRFVLLTENDVNSLPIDETVKKKFAAGLMSKNMYANIVRMFLLKQGAVW